MEFLLEELRLPLQDWHCIDNRRAPQSADFRHTLERYTSSAHSWPENLLALRLIYHAVLWGKWGYGL